MRRPARRKWSERGERESVCPRERERVCEREERERECECVREKRERECVREKRERVRERERVCEREERESAWERASVWERRERECARESARERASVSERERERDSAQEILYSYVKRVQWTSVARVGVFPLTIRLFWKYSRGKNDRAVGCGFLGYFYNVPRPPKVYVIAKWSYYKHSMVV